MKKSPNWVVRVFAAWLLFACSNATLFGASPSDEHAGYQGIPVRNGLNRGLIQHDELSSAERYPQLPRRKNESDILQSTVVDARNQNDPSSRTPDRGAYAGIPRRPDSQQSANANSTEAERAGYAGIPQQIAADRMTKRNGTFSAKRGSALVKTR